MRAAAISHISFFIFILQSQATSNICKNYAELGWLYFYPMDFFTLVWVSSLCTREGGGGEDVAHFARGGGGR